MKGDGITNKNFDLQLKEFAFVKAKKRIALPKENLFIPTNPITEQTKISVAVEDEKEALIKFFDMNGRII